MNILLLKSVLNKKRLLLICLEFLFWSTFAISPFIVIFLGEHGIESRTIGLMFSVNAVVGIFAQPVWGFISDLIKSTKIVFILCLSICSVMYIVLPFAGSTLLIGIMLGIDTFFRSPVVSLLDTWIISNISEKDCISYGSVRLWGSIGFAVTVFIYGKILETKPVDTLFPIYAVLVILTVTLYLFIKSGEATAEQMHIKVLNVSRLFKNYHYVVLMLFCFLLSIPGSSTSTFLPELFKVTGGTNEQYGLAHSMKAFAEIPFFLFGKQLLDKFGGVRLITFSALIYTVQQFLFASSASPGQVVLAQLLLGPAYSLFLLGMLEYIFQLAPNELKATSLTLVNALGSGLGTIAGNYGGGIFLTNIGLRPMLWTGFLIYAAAIILFLLSFLPDKKKGLFPIVKKNVM